MKHAILAAALVVIGWSNARADILPWARGSQRPGPAPTAPAVPIRIETTTGAEQTRLLIPRKLLPGFQSAFLDQGERKTQIAALPSSVIGITLAAALSLAGFCVMRKTRPIVRGGLTLLVLLLLTPGVISVAHAMNGVGVARANTTSYVPDFQLSGPIVVEVVETGDTVRLILSKKVPLEYRGK